MAGTNDSINFVSLWCDHYGLSVDTATMLRNHGCSSGESLLSLTSDELTNLAVDNGERCLLRGSLLQYAQAHDAVNKAIWRRLLMENVAEKKGHKRNKKANQKFRKVRHVDQFLETFQGDHDVTDVNKIMARFAAQKELRKRLHKKREKPSDNSTLAERILRQRESVEERSVSAPPPSDMTRITSSASLNSTKSSPAAPMGASKRDDVIPQSPVSYRVRRDPPKDTAKPNPASDSVDVKADEAPKHSTKDNGISEKSDILQTIQKFRDNLFTAEELELIASLGDNDPEQIKQREQEALDKIVNGDFNRELDKYLQT